MAKKKLNSRRRRKEKNRIDDPKELPCDIIFYEILPRLPAKSLMRSKSVCTSWFSLIDSDSFAADYNNFHHRRDRNPTNFLFFHYDEQAFYTSQIDQNRKPTPLTRLSINLPIEFSCPHIQSINGLVCVSMFVDDEKSSAGCVFNPTTKEWIEFPVSTSPWRCCPSYHFGFSPSKNEYKVLEVACHESEHLRADSEHLRFNIFTLHRDSSWKQLHVDLRHLPFDYRRCNFIESRVCLHGAIHWLHEKDNSIVVFDVVSEEFRVIPKPEQLINTFTAMGMVDVGGCLTLYGYGDDDSYHADRLPEKTLVLWILKDYVNHEWVKEIILISEWRFRPLCITHTGDLAIMTGLSNWGPPSLCLYNLKSKEIRKESFDLLGNFKRKHYKNWTWGRFALKTSYENSIVRLRNDQTVM